MEGSPPRRRETFTSLQLQRAADQLQDAMQSVRQRRSNHSSRSMSLSLLSDSSGDEMNEDPEDSDADQENRPVNHSSDAVSKPDRLIYTPSLHSKLRRFTADVSASAGRRVSGGSLSLKDLHASPLRPPRDLETMKLQLRNEVTKSAEVDKSKTAQSSGESMLKSVESTAHKALAVLQTELEAQAKANRAMQEHIKDVVDRINAFVTQTVGGEGSASLREDSGDVGKLLTLEKLSEVSDGWFVALEKWRNAVDTEKEEIIASSRLVEDDVCRKMEKQEESHKTELENLEAKLASKQRDVVSLQERIDSLVSTAASAEAKKSEADKFALQQHDRTTMENEDLRSQLCEKENAVVEEVADEPSAEQQQRHVLNLLAQLKQAELRELQWEMLFEDQCQETSRTKERLEMLLEDVATQRTRTAVSSHSRHVTASSTSSLSPRARRASFASSTTSSEFQLYQQRIEFLEDQLRDVREQINCDHHQFLYEQQKWEVEKKSMGHDVEEVHGVSVKVLKLLLIREKLLKRQELKLEKRVERLKRREQLLQQNQQLLQVSLETTMQECAVGLLYVRQLAMMPSPGERTSQDSPPVKPVKLVRLLKKLKNLQLEMASGGFGESCSGSRSSAAVS